MEIKDMTICFTLGKAQKNNEQKAYCIIMFNYKYTIYIYITNQHFIVLMVTSRCNQKEKEGKEKQGYPC